ncbi:lysine N(6)-hydroxylase/L-ornithine N(5)-oxygenase family protein [Pseudomonas lopnurensis]|uniref:lysine N(6)-hydroxylase/L-ornithine N(5)-oxygenase family protein n=1 Tax=Pseudomonas lopnurensis TaxID=1477517 RepID=UPI00187ADFFC|nr:SidA/IucD/PvdA family monooxygenase [Pseudomonas lopnurensis]MBE7376784.1 lysine N(6)-hydroxylase/L-ornithine N(5)-oxygenase family protein [Pseudomonas lopnurensis]
MTPTATPIHDVIGVGFGPSNMALAIALEELSQASGKSLDALFLDKQQHYRWHGDTLADGSEMQISFLKDLVSLRNPTSPYSFINYLHQHGRLIDFINLSTFYPCRMEFNDYLGWVAEQFADRARYGQEVVHIEPGVNEGVVDHLQVLSRDSEGQEQLYRARSVVVSTGGTAKIPGLFAGFKDDQRVFHHSRYLFGIRQLPCSQGAPMRIAIIGSGQSAAEAFMDLHENFPSVRVDMITRASAMKPADDTPFVNEVFAPAATDLMFSLSPEGQKQLLGEYRNTNYSVVDPSLIERIYGVLYRQKVSNRFRHSLLCRQQVQAVTSTPEGLVLTLRDLSSGQENTHRYDAVILATGYERNTHRNLLAPLKGYLQDYTVGRDYRVLTSPELKATIYLQGFCENTHGLSDTLLSVLPVRSEEIGKSLYRALEENATPASLTRVHAEVAAGA